jgi:hypothetical protein
MVVGAASSGHGSFWPGGERGNLGISRNLFGSTSMVEGETCKSEEEKKTAPSSLPAFALCPLGSKSIFWMVVGAGPCRMVASLEYME